MAQVVKILASSPKWTNSQKPSPQMFEIIKKSPIFHCNKLQNSIKFATIRFAWFEKWDLFLIFIHYEPLKFSFSLIGFFPVCLGAEGEGVPLNLHLLEHIWKDSLMKNSTS